MTWSKDGALALGARIRQLRKDRGLTQEGLAHLAGLTKNQIQLIEAGRGSAREDGPPSNLRLKSLFGIAKVLGTTPAGLISDLEGIGDSVDREADADATDPEASES